MRRIKPTLALLWRVWFRLTAQPGKGLCRHWERLKTAFIEMDSNALQNIYSHHEQIEEARTKKCD
jgi:hypothetical protein